MRKVNLFCCCEKEYLSVKKEDGIYGYTYSSKCHPKIYSQRSPQEQVELDIKFNEEKFQNKAKCAIHKKVHALHRSTS